MLPSSISISQTTLSLLLSVTFANEQCRCTKYFMGCHCGWDHVNCCLYHARNWNCAQNHVLRALESMCNNAGFSTKHKMVLTSEGNRRADLEVLNIRVAQQTDLLVEVSLHHDLVGAGLDGGRTHGKHRNPDNPEKILESAAAQKIRDCRKTYRRNRQVAFLLACMSTSCRIYGDFLRLLFFLAFFKAFGYQPHKQEFCHRRSASSSSKPGAPLGWHVLRLWRYVALPPPRVAASRHFATCRPSKWPTRSMTAMSATSTASPR
jgi:hypothetical protein